MTARSRRRQLGIATGELGITAVIVFVAWLIGVGYWEHLKNKTVGCLQLLATAADGRLEGATCPVSGKPFVVGRKDGRETVVCPANHLPTPPHYSRIDGKEWRLEQDLAPPVSVKPEYGHGATYYQVSGGGTSTWIVLKPRLWWRWLVGPIVQLLAVVYLIALIVQAFDKERGSRGILAVSIVTAIAFGWGAWVSVPTVEGSEAFEFDAPQRRVVHHRYRFGSEREPTVYDNCDGVVWVGKALMLYHRAPEGRRVVVLDSSFPDGDLAAWVKSRF